MMPPDLINSPQKKKILSNLKKAVKNESSSIQDEKNGLLPEAKAANKIDKNNTSITKKIDLKIKEEIMESNSDLKNTKTTLVKKQNIQQKDQQFIQETTTKTKITKKRKLIKEETNNNSLNQSPNINNFTNEFNPLDNILNEIDAFDTSNKPKNKKKREKMPKIESPSDDLDSGNAPCSSQQFPTTPFPSSGSTRQLNKIELARQEHDNSMVQVFLRKDDLMERILAYKMLRGRVESFLTMKAKIDLNNCITPEYEIRPDLVEPVSERLHPKLELLIKKEQQTEAIEEEQQPPLPPPFPPPPLFDSSASSFALHGPMTPPGSPGTNQSSLTGNDQQQIHKQIFLSTLINNEEQSHRHKFDKSESNSITNEELFKKFGSMLGLPEKQILTFFGVDLKKYADLQFDELLATFRESLTKHLSEKEKKKQETSPTASGDYIEQLQQSSHSKQQESLIEQQNLMNVSDELEAAMEISSTSSSGIFLPPPPAPPPMLLCNSNSIPSTSREEALEENNTKNPALISDSFSQHKKVLQTPLLQDQKQQLIFTRPPPPIPTPLITRSSAPQLLSHNQPPPQLFLHPPPHKEEIGAKVQNFDPSIIQQQKRPPSLFSQIPLVFNTPPPPVHTKSAIPFMTNIRPGLAHQQLPPPLHQQFLHPPPRPPPSSKDMNEPEAKVSGLIQEPLTTPQQKKIPSLFSPCQPLLFPRPPPPIPISLATTPPPRMIHPLPLNHHLLPHSSTSEIETKSQPSFPGLLSSKFFKNFLESSVVPQQQKGVLTPPFPPVSLVFTTPPPTVPTPARPSVATFSVPKVPPPPQQQFLPPPPMPSQNDILKTVVQAINVGKSKEINNNNKVKNSVMPEKDDSSVTNKSSPYGKFF